MEDELDKVESGEMSWLSVVKGFWEHFESILKGVENTAKVEVPLETIDEECPKCGAQLVIKHGRYGKFIACSAFPECKYTRNFTNSLIINCPKCKEEKLCCFAPRKPFMVVPDILSAILSVGINPLAMLPQMRRPFCGEKKS